MGFLNYVNAVLSALFFVSMAWSAKAKTVVAGYYYKFLCYIYYCEFHFRRLWFRNNGYIFKYFFSIYVSKCNAEDICRDFSVECVGYNIYSQQLVKRLDVNNVYWYPQLRSIVMIK